LPENDAFVKRGPAETVALEVMRSRAASALASSSGAFYVPAVIEEDAGDGWASFERLRHFHTVCDLARSGDERLLGTLRGIGVALALVHAALPRLAGDDHGLPEWARGAEDDVVTLHGDLTAANAGLDDDRGVVLLDWAGNPRLGAAAAVGNRYFDLVWFTMSVYWSIPIRERPTYPARQMCDAFISGYRTGQPFEVARFLAFDDRHAWSLGFRRSGGPVSALGEGLRLSRWRAYRRHLGSDVTSFSGV
jgi:hypothetical protein